VHNVGVAVLFNSWVSLNVHEQKFKAFTLLIVSTDKVEQQGFVRCIWMYGCFVNVVRVKKVNSHSDILWLVYKLSLYNEVERAELFHKLKEASGSSFPDVESSGYTGGFTGVFNNVIRVSESHLYLGG